MFMAHFGSSQMKRLWVLLIVGLICAATTNLYAQVCGVPGRQGLVTTASLAPNTYYAGTGSPAAGVNAITLATGTNATRGVASNLLVGDLVLVVQMQDSSGGLEGNYEYAVVTVGGGVGATIQLASPLVNSYAQSVSPGTMRTYQVVRVPQYSAATLSGTINVLPWFIEPTNGFGTGGVYAVDVAGALTLNGVTIDAHGKGFRGGRGVDSQQNRAGGSPFDANYACTAATLNGALKGEGSEGTPQQVFGYNIGATAGAGATYDAAGQVFNAGQGYLGGSCGQGARGNAGGGGNDGIPPAQTNGFNSGGGGGANAGAGGIGGNTWNSNDNTLAANNDPTSAANSGLGGFDAGGRGGNTLTPNVTAKVYLGGGGGAGSSNNGTADTVTTFPPTAGAAANGAVGTITSSGSPGGGHGVDSRRHPGGECRQHHQRPGRPFVQQEPRCRHRLGGWRRGRGHGHHRRAWNGGSGQPGCQRFWRCRWQLQLFQPRPRRRRWRRLCGHQLHWGHCRRLWRRTRYRRLLRRHNGQPEPEELPCGTRHTGYFPDGFQRGAAPGFWRQCALPAQPHGDQDGQHP